MLASAAAVYLQVESFCFGSRDTLTLRQSASFPYGPPAGEAGGNIIVSAKKEMAAFLLLEKVIVQCLSRFS